MRLREVYSGGRFGLSFEIFPPKSAEGDESLRGTLRELAPYQPAFISCTYGAGGSTSKRTVEWCREIQEQFEIPATAHFTCVGSTRQELLDWLAYASEAKVANIMALRGDPPQGQGEFRPPVGGLAHANELVALIRSHFPEFGIGVAGYPEKHPQATDLATDLGYLVQKVNAGADAIFTQLFFDNSAFLRFREELARQGVTVPVIPGIMPITEFSRIVRITSMCGSVIPQDLASRLEQVKDDRQAQFEIGVDYAIAQCRGLLEAGVPGIHFYVLNRSEACRRILDALSLATAS